MNSHASLLLILTSCVFIGCTRTVRSISDSGYPQTPSYCHATAAGNRDFDYKGELSEFDILGIARGELTSEAEIRRALDNSKQIKLRPGASLLLIQSGAQFPDGPMLSELSKNFLIVPFSGVPPRRSSADGQFNSADPESYAKSLRLAAARGGAETIICYWGVLESETEDLATKTVSWVPIVNWLVPDEKQHMRMRLKVALVDVRSGNWAVFSPAAVDGARISSSPRRAAVDQKQVEKLKGNAYTDAAGELVRLYSGSETQLPSDR